MEQSPHSSNKTNLPAEPNDLIGRDRDSADLRALLEVARIVTLCGPGGIGKTRLALRVAMSLLGEYADGNWYVDLADAVPEQATGADPVTRRVAGTLRIAEEEDAGPLDGVLAEALRSRKLLLVLDNCEHLVDDCARLARTLLARCPGLRILATSREPLRVPGENVWRVPPLELDAAARLFAARAGAARSDFAGAGSAAVAEVCRALDGVPLALELAAARLRVLSVQEVAARLADRFRLLTTGDRTAPPRQRTLRAAIDWSHGLLGEAERVLLRRLTVFAGWRLDQAEQVCSDDELPAEDVLDVLSSLVDKSLVVVDREVAGATRFRLLDSIREYGRERLIAVGEEEALRRRHREVLLELAEYDAEVALAEQKAPWSARIELFQRWDADMGNLRAALAWSLERGDTEDGLRLCIGLRAYSLPRGYFAECCDWTDRFMARGSLGVAPGIWGAAHIGRAQLAVAQRDFALAHRMAETGVPLCRAAGDGVMLAAGLDILAQAGLRAGRLAEAEGLLDEAISVARAGGDQWNEGLALTTRGALLAMRGRLREAQQMYEAGLAIMQDIDQLWGASRALIGLGQLAQHRGDPATARACYEEALPMLRGIRAAPEIARCLGGIGRVALDQRDLVQAREVLAESLTLSRDSGLRLGIARGLETFAALTALEGDPRRAVLLAGAASALREGFGRPAGAAAPRGAGAGARLERTLEPIRRMLGEGLVAQLWGQGMATPADDAVAYALRPPDRDAVPAPRQPTGEERGPAGEKRGPSGEGRGPSGGESGPAGEGRGTVGERRGPAGESRGRSGEVRGAAGEERGAAGEGRGRSGAERGSAGEWRGPAGEERGPSGGERGPSGGERGTAGEERGPSGEWRGSAGEERGSAGDWRGRSGGERGSAGDWRGRSGGERGPSGEWRGSAGGERGPAGEGGWPTGEERGPVGEGRGVTGEHRGPAGEVRRPAGEDRGPAAVVGGATPLSPARPVTPPTTLTPREREIAKLIARGLSNRGIADELVISPATVARHVTNILTKLGFASRAQVAAWAVDNIPDR